MTTHRYPVVDFIGATRVGGIEASQPTLGKPPAWMDQAACNGAAPQIFELPESGATTATGRMAIELYCDRCPVRDACAAWADEHHEQGIWGGVPRGRTYYEPSAAAAREKTIEDVEYILATNPDVTADSVARRVGYARADSLQRMLHRAQRRDLTDQLARNADVQRERVRMQRKGSAA